VRELSEELSAAAEKRIPLEQNIPALAVADEVQQLQIQLEALIAKEENRPFLNLNYENEQASILQASLSKKLVSHLEALAAKGKKKSGQKPSEGSGQITYELFCSPEIAKSIKEGNEVAMIAEMDKRISQLEKLLGTNTFKGNMPRADLFSLIEILNDKLALLNPEELDKVDRRLKMLSTELDELARSEEATALPAHQEKKVNELYEIMSRADVTIQQIPAIIARLQSLRPLYDESLTFSQTLRHLHQQQSQIFQMLTSHNSHLIKVEDGLAENISIIQKNINSLGTRLEKVSEKLSSSSPS
jgi:Mg2+ and Co2+ transporter CorA